MKLPRSNDSTRRLPTALAAKMASEFLKTWVVNFKQT
jgi:hypothetical protein